MGKRILGVSPKAVGVADLEQRRLFVAVDPPPDVLDQIEPVRSEFQAAGLRLVKSEQIHLTLVFLGNVDASRIEEIRAALIRPARAAIPLRLGAVGIGTFSQGGRTSVGWIGIRDRFGDLREVQENVTKACSPLVQELEDRPFRGHLTIAREKRDHAVDEREIKAIVRRWNRFVFAEWLAPEIVLYSSEKVDSGRSYVKLQRFRAED